MKKKCIFFTLTILLLSSLIINCSVKKNLSSSPNNSNENNNSTELNIYAASSLKNVMKDIENEFKKTNSDINLTINYDASGSLQNQIEQGEPCDVFISAGQNQMKALDSKSLLASGTKKDLVKNSLVLVSIKDSVLTSISDLTTANVTKIGIGDPQSVPAGQYADEALTNLGIKDAVSSKLVLAKDEKEVLSWSASSVVDVGFVYKSDALSNNSCKIIDSVPDDKHSPIIYSVAVIKSSKNYDSAKAFEDFLFTDTCKKLFKESSFTLV